MKALFPFFPPARRLLTTGLMLIALLSTLPAARADGLFPDAQLETVIREVLRKQGQEELKEEDLKNVFIVSARKKGIKSLAGLEKCPSLVQLDLSGNEVEDIAPLSGLVNLQSLDLSSNKVRDLKPLEKLAKLQYLQLEHNQVEDIAVLGGLKKLAALYLTDNKVASVEPLKDMPKLASLYLGKNQLKSVAPLGTNRWVQNLDLRDNQIEDPAPLAGLTELRFTFLQNNRLTDFGVLIEMAKKDAAGEKRFAPYWKLYLDGNPIDAAKRDAQIAALKEQGVRVNWKQP